MGLWPFSSSGSLPSETSDRSSNIPPTASSPSQPQSQSSQTADQSLESFLSSLEAPSKRVQHHSPEPTTSTTSPAQYTPAPSSTDAAPVIPETNTSPADLDISPAALYPRTMSCRAAFDQAFYCQSLGGKFNDIYRHGALQSCTEQWNAFWFCMRVKSYGEESKQEVISEYYREREERKKKAYGSSEDVWEMRTQAVERAFWRDPDAEGEGEVKMTAGRGS